MSAILLAFCFASSGSLTWTPERDYNVTGGFNTGNNPSAALVSTDPTLTLANLGTPSASAVVESVIFYANGSNHFHQYSPVFLPERTKVTVTSGAQQTIFLFLDELI